MQAHIRVATTLILSAFAGAAFAQALEISGSTTVQKRLIEPHASAVKSATGVEVKIYGVGSGKGMIALAEQKAAAAAVSESLEEAIASARKAAQAEGREFKAPADLKMHELTSDSVVVVVHRDNPVRSLTREQIRDINVGRVRNWKEVGGPDLPVKVVTGPPGAATRALLQARFMDNQPYAPETAEMRTTLEEIKVISLSKGAVGAMSENVARAAADRVAVVKGPELKRPLALVTIGAPSPAAQKVIDFYRSREGQKLIAQ